MSLFIGPTVKLKIMLTLLVTGVGGIATYGVISSLNQQRQPLTYQLDEPRGKSSPGLPQGFFPSASDPAVEQEQEKNHASGHPPPPGKKRFVVPRRAISRTPSEENSSPWAAAEGRDSPSMTSAHAAIEESESANDPEEPPHPARANGCSVDDEVALLSKAQAALNRRQGQRALGLLGQYERDCSRATFHQEHRLVRVLTFCLLGRQQEARIEAARLLKETHRSLYLAKLRASCVRSLLEEQEP
jgi:hypothetical protein